MVGLVEGSEPTDIIGNHLNTLALTIYTTASKVARHVIGRENVGGRTRHNSTGSLALQLLSARARKQPRDYINSMLSLFVYY